jgi:hypothetical protein
MSSWVIYRGLLPKPYSSRRTPFRVSTYEEKSEKHL